MSFKTKSRMAAGIMLLFATGFLFFAITHPTASFPWNNTITYFIYIVYIVITVVLFIAPSKKKR